MRAYKGLFLFLVILGFTCMAIFAEAADKNTNSNQSKTSSISDANSKKLKSNTKPLPAKKPLLKPKKPNLPKQKPTQNSQTKGRLNKKSALDKPTTPASQPTIVITPTETIEMTGNAGPSVNNLTQLRTADDINIQRKGILKDNMIHIEFPPPPVTAMTNSVATAQVLTIVDNAWERVKKSIPPHLADRQRYDEAMAEKCTGFSIEEIRSLNCGTTIDTRPGSYCAGQIHRFCQRNRARAEYEQYLKSLDEARSAYMDFQEMLQEMNGHHSWARTR